MTIEKIEKISVLHDERHQTWFDVYHGPGIEGPTIEFEVPRADCDAKTVRRIALGKGVSKAAADDLSELTKAVETEAPVVHRASHTGWREDKRVFVSHRHIAGTSANGTVVPPVCDLIGSQGQLETAGTLGGWQKVAEVAKHSTAMTVALCAAFAAPLLELVERGNFAVLLYGPSRCGKSSTQLVAASVIGFGREEDLPGLGATKAGLLSACLELHGHMLPINEVGTADGPKREIYVALRNSTYQLMSGQDVMRHPSWPGAKAGAPTKFRVICLSNGVGTGPRIGAQKGPHGWMLDTSGPDGRGAVGGAIIRP